MFDNLFNKAIFEGVKEGLKETFPTILKEIIQTVCELLVKNKVSKIIFNDKTYYLLSIESGSSILDNYSVKVTVNANIEYHTCPCGHHLRYDYDENHRTMNEILCVPCNIEYPLKFVK